MEGLDLPVIPAANSVVPPVPGVLGPTSSEAAAGGDTPKDKSEGAGLAAGLVGGKTKEAEVQPFLFSQGFPPVPAKLVGKILRLEFVDMAELLRDNIKAERRRGSQGESSSGSKHTRREIPDILSWLQCFGIYISVMASKFPERVPNMLAYQTTLVREARRCGGSGWMAYDTAFRQQAATDPHCDWSKLNNSLYPVTFMVQASGRGKCCPHCLESDHPGDKCALSPRPRQESRQRPRSPGLGWQAHGTGEGRREPRSEYQAAGKQKVRGGRQVDQRGGIKICYSFNDGECRFPNSCRYLHICQRCQATPRAGARRMARAGGSRQSEGRQPGRLGARRRQSDLLTRSSSDPQWTPHYQFLYVLCNICTRSIIHFRWPPCLAGQMSAWGRGD